MNAIRKAWLRELGVERSLMVPQRPQVLESKQLVPPVASVQAHPRQTEETQAAAETTAEVVAALAPPATAETPLVPAPMDARDAEQVWAAFQQEVAACVACGLCKGRTQTVFGVGRHTASWMVVGEAPGEQEDKQGKPFVGRSGKLLDSMLAAVGRSREVDVFIANVIKCRPPGNRDPEPEEVAHCSPFLKRQIAMIKPSMILVVGRFAAQTLLGTDAKIGSLRGRVHSIDVEGRAVPVVVSYHPAYLLRSPAEKAKAWQDLQLAKSLDSGGTKLSATV